MRRSAARSGHTLCTHTHPAPRGHWVTLRHSQPRASSAAPEPPGSPLWTLTPCTPHPCISCRKHLPSPAPGTISCSWGGAGRWDLMLCIFSPSGHIPPKKIPVSSRRARGTPSSCLEVEKIKVALWRVFDAGSGAWLNMKKGLSVCQNGNVSNWNSS